MFNAVPENISTSPQPKGLEFPRGTEGSVRPKLLKNYEALLEFP